MLKRKITTSLLEWKTKARKKSLVVQGARQVGKTFAIREFGKSQYVETLEVNFKETPSAAEIFHGDLMIDGLVASLRFRYPQLAIEPGKTLIFLDEIQECPEAITSLKFWTDDGRYDVIASGSMLGIDYNRPSSYPVGYVEYLTMHGLDFEEFLWSQGIASESISPFKEMFSRVSPIPQAMHGRMFELYRTYSAIGGMPEAVQTYVSTTDFREVDRVQRELLQGYLYDIAHYATASEKVKAEQCYLSLGAQLLGKENTKFQYKMVEKNGKAQKFLSSIEWLQRADIAAQSANVRTIEFDLADYEIEGNFRLYPTDLSLLLGMRDFSLKQAIVENTLSGSTKGGFYECAAADAFLKSGHTLHFYRNDTKKIEIDFLIQMNGGVMPIEVKGGNKPAISLRRIAASIQSKSGGTARPGTPCAYKFADCNMGMSEEGIVSAPLYMMGFL